MRPCDTVAEHPFTLCIKRPLPYASYGSFNFFKISTSEFDTVSMRSHIQTCVDEFLAMVTDGVTQSKNKDVARSPSGVTQSGEWR